MNGTTTSHDEFWADLDGELGAVPPALELKRHAYLSGPEYTVYMARFSSLGHHRVTGYLSIPTAPGPHSGLLELPSRYGSVVHVPHPNDRRRHVVLTLMHRGQRLSDVPLKASFPGFFSRGIEDPRTWVYRGVVADCLRASEVLASIEAVDPSRIGAVGDDSTIIVAARRQSLAAIRVDVVRYSGAWSRRRSTDAYPLEGLNELERRNPSIAAKVESTLAMFDPAVQLASEVDVPALVTIPEGVDRQPYQRLIQALGAGATAFPTSHFEYEHDDARDAWISAQLGVEPMTRFDHAAGRRAARAASDVA